VQGTNRRRESRPLQHQRGSNTRQQVESRRNVMQLLDNPLIIPLGAFMVIVFLMLLDSIRRMRETELDAYRDLRIREMEHLRRIKELDVEHSRAKSHASS
jgi:hypothetical protein